MAESSFEGLLRRLIREELEAGLAGRDFMDVQVPDDTADAGTEGYACGYRFTSEAGHRLGTIAADTQHNHLGFYTRDAPVEKVADGSPWAKRMNIQGGEDETQVRLYSADTSRFIVSSRGGSGESNVQWVTRSGNQMHMGVTESGGYGYLSNIGGTERGSVLTFDLHGEETGHPNALGVNGNPVYGRREVPNPTKETVLPGEEVFDPNMERIVYRSSTTGELYWFSPCATL